MNLISDCWIVKGKAAVWPVIYISDPVHLDGHYDVETDSFISYEEHTLEKCPNVFVAEALLKKHGVTSFTVLRAPYGEENV